MRISVKNRSNKKLVVGPKRRILNVESKEIWRILNQSIDFLL